MKQSRQNGQSEGQKMRIKFMLASIICGSFSGACAQEETNKVGPLLGTWENEGFTVTYFAEGFAVPVSKSSGRALGTLEATLSDDLLSLRNLTAPNGATPESTECSMSNAGLYRLLIEDNVLTMQAVSDPCQDRADSVSSFVMNRAEMEQ